MTVNALSFSGVEKHYGRQPVLRGINLQVRSGESLGLVGVNGAGKSTLIKCLLDFTSMDGGGIRLFDVDSTVPESRKPLAYLPEKFIPPYYLTARNFLQYMMNMHKVPWIEEDIGPVLVKVDFEREALDKPVRQLSKGMAQKLGLAACLLSGRELLILDEPMSGLDPRARASVKRHLQALVREGRTLFFSTHLLADVEVLCDRVAILHEGTIRFLGSPAECCEHYGSSDLEEAYLMCVRSEA